VGGVEGGFAGRRNGPVRQRLRQRYLQPHGLRPPIGLSQETIDVAGLRRSYWLASVPDGDAGTAPLLIVLHGAGGQGPGMASLTGLDRRGPAAGFVTVFPDGQGRVWNDSRGAGAFARRQNVDDVAFLQALSARLAGRGLGQAAPVYLAGISNGALMCEHLARHGLLIVDGIALIAGPATAASRAAVPRPLRPTSVLVFAGTADPLIPYGGGPIGPLGRIVQRRAGGTSDRGIAVPAEVVAGDWAAANGLPAAPTIDGLRADPGELPVTRLTWSTRGRKPVVLYRIDGGGHTWPGGPQYLPERLVGPTTRSVDATAILLDQFHSHGASGG
jgi:polyhydroxybutyrate depolymerase